VREVGYGGSLEGGLAPTLVPIDEGQELSLQASDVSPTLRRVAEQPTGYRTELRYLGLSYPLVSRPCRVIASANSAGGASGAGAVLGTAMGSSS